MLQKFLGLEFPAENRAGFLRDNCDKVEEIGYMKEFTPEEIEEKKDQLAEASIKINDIEIEKKEVMSDFKKRLDPLSDSKSVLLKQIKERSEFVKEECFKFVDYDQRMVGYYNSEGSLVNSRPIYADEAQRNIFTMKTGTSN